LSPLTLFSTDLVFPLPTLEDLLTLFDRSVLPKSPLQVIYYQVLDLAPFSPTLTYLFSTYLGSLFSQTEQRAVRALWHIDNTGGSIQSCTQIISEVISHRELIGHVDHAVY
jgi:hypothetical protein